MHALTASVCVCARARAQVRRYIEVGVFTAWTCCFVSAYLRRVGTLGAFRGFAVDITTVALAVGTKALLPHLNVTFLRRASVSLPPSCLLYTSPSPRD